MHSTVATTLNQLGVLAYNRDDYPSARSYFTEALNTYRQLYGDQHSAVAVAYSNLGSVCLDEKDYPCAEKMFQQSTRLLDAISAVSVNAAVAHLKLGRTLLREGRLKDAEPQTLAAYKYLVKQMAPTNNYLVASRKDLAAIYDGLHDPQQASRYRSELTLTSANR